MKACVECKHFKGAQANQAYQPHLPQREAQPECLHPEASSRDMIYGKAFCHTERTATKGCGKQGKLWQPKAA